MKKILVVAVLLLIAVIVYTQRNSTKTAYVNGLAAYNSLPGREYIFERDCYIFKFKDHNTEWPLVGANAPGVVGSVAELPSEVSEKSIGAKLQGVRILDVVKSGSRFKIVSVRRDQTRDQTTITFEILFTDEADRHYPRLDAYCILDHSPEKNGQPPHIVEEYAVERVKK